MVFKKTYDYLKEMYAGKVGLVDAGSRISYSAIVGGLLQYLGKPLTKLVFPNTIYENTGNGNIWQEILLGRAYATLINSVTSAPYGRWREKMFKWTKTTEKNSKTRQNLVDFLSFNTFETPIYATSIAVSQLLTRGELDLEEIATSSAMLGILSPGIAPTMNYYMDLCRKAFKVKPAVKRAYEKTKI